MSSLDPDYSYVSGKKNQSIRKFKQYGLEVDINSIGDRKWHVRFFVNLIGCPPGLMLLPNMAVIDIIVNSSFESGKMKQLC